MALYFRIFAQYFRTFCVLNKFYFNVHKTNKSHYKTRTIGDPVFSWVELLKSCRLLGTTAPLHLK